MAYADRNVGGSRIVAIVIVALIVAGMGYAFVTGLAYQFIKKKVDDLNAFDVKDPPPPPPEELPPPPPPDKSAPPPPTFIPQAAVQVQQPVQTQVQTQTAVQVKDPTPIFTPKPVEVKPPVKPSIAKQLQPRNPGSWVTNDDYPSAAIRSEASGTTGFRLDVDASGKVSNCTVTSSSGNALLDSTACSLLKRRARFGPAEDSSGNKIPAVYTNRFRWELPRE
jgi:periplasmic protein TonB